ncbi:MULTISPECIES: WD40 repeat domain-containing serine/threonine protein kinase [Pseudofrankia]|uniref:WD40 repeat domain-containing serine/threonine protein kinase n=1 Tax=Pseudofrankia TaxID=2994363 RepID=UPI000234C15C|nr:MULTISPECIES: serine/threonine-protein kinase [Pseudofrankia]
MRHDVSSMWRPLDERDPEQVGPYRLLGRAGVGGMGVVYVAETAEGRRVAVKVIRDEWARDQEFRARFRREIAVVRRVDGFCTAPVIDADADSPRPYLVTEFVRGPSLSQMIKEDGPLAPAALKQVAVAVATALVAIHRVGVVHRDLKPSNVLMSPVGPKVIDFGIARALDAVTGATSQFIGQLGTPGFMAPEQASLDEVTAAADVFAWGAMVVFAGTGRQPFGAGPVHVLTHRVVHEPPRLDGLDPSLLPLVQAAMAKDPALRPSAQDLLARLLAAEPAEVNKESGAFGQLTAAGMNGTHAPASAPAVEAKPTSHPSVSASAATVDSTPTADGAMDEAARATLTGRTVLAGPAFIALEAVPDGERSGPPRRGAMRWARSRTRLLVVTVVATAAITLAVVLAVAPWSRGTGQAAGSTAQQQLAASSRRLADLALTTFETDRGLGRRLAAAAYRIAPTPEARTALTMTVYDSANTQIFETMPDSNVTFSADGALAATSSWRTREVKVWTVSADGVREIATLPSLDTVDDVAFSPDRRMLAVANQYSAIQVWDISSVSSPTLTTTIPQLGTLFGVTFTHDSAFVATIGYSDGTIAALWDAHTGRRVSTFTIRGADPDRNYWSSALVLSRHGAMAAVQPADGGLELWTIPGDAPATRRAVLPEALGFLGAPDGVDFSPDERVLATASGRRDVRLWDIGRPDSPTPLGALTGHTDSVVAVKFSPDGRTLATSARDRTVRIWDVADPRAPRLLSVLTGNTDVVFDLAFSDDGRTLTTATSFTGVIRRWDLTAPRSPVQVSTLAGHQSWVRSATFSPHSGLLASASNDGTVRLWDAAHPGQPGRTLRIAASGVGALDAAFSPDGALLATAAGDGTARLWELAPAGTGSGGTPRARGALDGHTKRIWAVAFSPDGRTVATASDDDTARLWDVSNPDRPRPIAVLTGHTQGVRDVEFSPDGRTLATVSDDHTARLWDVANVAHPTMRATLTGHTSHVLGVAFSPDGRTLATTSEDTTVRLWNIGTSAPTLTRILTGHVGRVWGVMFSPDGQALATASGDDTVRFWDLRHPGRSAILVGHTKGVLGAAFSPDGNYLATTSDDYAVRLWDLNPADALRRLCTQPGSGLSPQEWQRFVPDLEYHPLCP